MRCSRCGNENAGQNRFCGMCGASLLATPISGPSTAQAQPVSVSASAGAAPELTPARTEPHTESAKPARVETPANNRPAISGPSFLGLNDPSPSRSNPQKRARLSIDPHSAPGSNLDYLLSDEEPPRHWGPGKILFILIALALAFGFGYLRFKNQGSSWLSPPAKKPDAAATQNAPAENNQPSASSGTTPESQPSGSQPIASAAQPVPEGAAANGNPPSSTPPVSNAPAASTANPSSTPETAKPSDAIPAASPEPKSTADNSSASPSQPTDAAPPARKSEVPKPPKPSPAKPSPVSRPAVAADPVTEAQKYLYGRGVPQDCERGMRMLKPAANQSNPKAMVEMGALYSAGLCTPHDLPTAYRWFALALRRDPENTTIQSDLSKLWGEMTPPERQLAIKLTQ